MYIVREAGDGREVRCWAVDLDEKAMQQALTSARSPVVAGPVALMPDAHFGFGATVGSVIVTAADGPAAGVIPSAVGVDIGCGMVAVRTDLVDSDRVRDGLGGFVSDLERVIPAGVGQGHDPFRARRAVDAWFAENPPPVPLGTNLAKKAGNQLGSLGSGNHFAEVCVDEERRVWLMLHSGSRGVGNQLAQTHINEAKSLARDLGRATGDPDLAYFLAGDPGYRRYLDAMLWAQEYAAANRSLMVNAMVASFTDRVGPFKIVDRVDCHHNYCVLERHDGRDLWVTRKGAIRAGVGDRGIIPGSMGAASYITVGLGNPDSYHSASHGAGRTMSRGQARRSVTVDQLRDAMAGRVWLDRHAGSLLDEAPAAYKDIDEVMAAQADLVAVQHRLEAVANYKGC